MDEVTSGKAAIQRACCQAQAQAHDSIIADQAAIIVLGWTGFKAEQAGSFFACCSATTMDGPYSCSCQALLICRPAYMLLHRDPYCTAFDLVPFAGVLWSKGGVSLGQTGV